MDVQLSSPLSATMRVQKRGGRGFEDVKFDKVTIRLDALIREAGYGNTVNAVLIAQQTIKNLYDGITTEELDYIAANIAESRKLVHPNYSQLAGQILISNLHKTTPAKFSVCMRELEESLKIMSPVHMQFIADNADALDGMITHAADYQFGYLAYKTLEKQYLHKVREPVMDIFGKPKYVDFDGNPVTTEVSSAAEDFALIAKPLMRYRVHDRPQYMFMRVAVEVAIAGVVNRLLASNIAVTTLSADNLVQYRDSILGQISIYYTALSKMNFIFATPTNFNACTKFAQLNSCFLLNTDDSIEEIMRTVTNAALISKRAGGIGIAMHKIRCRGAEIKGTNGESSGLIPQIKIYNEDAACWNQGGGKRLGAFAIYLEPWHGDILQFLRLKLTQGEDAQRARNLHYGLWMPDLFMIRARTDAWWSLFSEDTAPGLSEVYDGMLVCKRCGYCANRNYIELVRKGVLTAGDAGLSVGTAMFDASSGAADVFKRFGNPELWHCSCEFRSVDVFTNLYVRYERGGKIVRRVRPSVIIDAMAEVQRDQGEPYVCFKDHANRQSNHMNLGTLQSSNLCTEIFEWHSADQYACCSLASINVKKYLVWVSVPSNGQSVPSNGQNVPGKWTLNKAALIADVALIVRGLDNIISANKYPVKECKVNAHSYRPIGIGVQGLADAFMIMRIPFLSAEAEMFDLEIFETIYWAALNASCELATEFGSYDGFVGSPYSRGELRQDMWMANQSRMREYGNGMIERMEAYNRSGRSSFDWNEMRQRVRGGVRNSLLVALMPTVTTSQLLDNNESFEPMAANIYTKSTLAGKFTMSNNLMIKHLIELGLWNDNIKTRVMNNNGSLQSCPEIPADIREIYKTVWEMRQTQIMERAGLRQAFIDQGQSLNEHITDNSNGVYRGILTIGWELGLNTGNYYIRSRAAVDPMKNNAVAIKESQEIDTVQIQVNTSQGNVPVWNVVATGPACEAGCDSCGS